MTAPETRAGTSQAEGDLYGSSEFVKWLDSASKYITAERPLKAVYPGSSTHIDVADFFGWSNVVHVDVAPTAVNALISAGYIACNDSAARFSEQFAQQVEPENWFDLMVALSAPVSGFYDRLVKPGGFVVCNSIECWDYFVAEGYWQQVETPYDNQIVTGRHFHGTPTRLFQVMEEAP